MYTLSAAAVLCTLPLAVSGCAMATSDAFLPEAKAAFVQETVSSSDLTDDTEPTDDGIYCFSMSRQDEDTEMPGDAVTVNLSDYDDICAIERGGEYLLEGALHGKLVVDAQDQNVHFYLQNASVNAIYGSAVRIDSAGKVCFTLLPDTENSFSDTRDYEESEDEHGCLFSNADVTFNGSGALTVTGSYSQAMHCEQRVRFNGGTYSITAVKDGIIADKGALIRNAQFTLEAGENGIVTKKNGKNHKGAVEIIPGKVSVTAGQYGIYAMGAILLHSGGCSIDGESGQTASGKVILTLQQNGAQ